MVQPDIVKMGGITGLMRCAALAHAHGVELVPHQTQPMIGHTGEPARRRGAIAGDQADRVERSVNAHARGVREPAEAGRRPVSPADAPGLGLRLERSGTGEAHCQRCRDSRTRPLAGEVGHRAMAALTRRRRNRARRPRARHSPAARRAAPRSGSRSVAGPMPPPPGISTTSRSPGGTTASPFGFSSSPDFSDSRPACPAPPPCRPRAGYFTRSNRAKMPNAASSRDADLHHLPKPAALAPGAAGILPQLLAPDHQRRDRLGRLHRHVAHTGRKRCRRQSVLLTAAHLRRRNGSCSP